MRPAKFILETPKLGNSSHYQVMKITQPTEILDVIMHP